MKSKIRKFPFHLSGKSDDSTVRPKNPPGTGPAVCSLLTKRSEEPPVSGNSSPILFPKILPANRLSENHTVLCGIEPQQLQQRLFLEAAPCNGLQTVSGGIEVHVLRISACIGRAPETDAVHRLIPLQVAPSQPPCMIPWYLGGATLDTNEMPNGDMYNSATVNIR